MKSFLSNRRLAANVFWNFLGTVAPQLVALVAIPILVEGLGSARFGVLTIAWMIVGYFSLFDFGLGRALTKLVAEKIGANKEDQIPEVVWTAMLMMAVLGVVAAVLIAGSAPWLASRALKIPFELQPEALDAFYLLALSVPIVISTIGLRGVLEAHQRFDAVNLIRLPLGVLTFLGPVAVLPFSSSISHVVLVLVIARFGAWFAYLFANLLLFPTLREYVFAGRDTVRRLLSYGGWMTVSNITAPLLLYLGRILIIVMISAEAVAWFVTPYEVVVNLLVIPTILISVLFPAFATLFEGNVQRAFSLYKRANIIIFAVMLPMCLIVAGIAKPGLEWWINKEFSENGFRVAQVLALGIFINSFGHLSQALIQSYGRPDITAKLHLCELIIYIPYLWILIGKWGIVGAAIAWTIRVTISTVALGVLSRVCLSGKIQPRY